MTSEIFIDAARGTFEKRTIVVGSLSKAGYMRVRFNGKSDYVHRVIWEHVNGPIPKGMHIDHINRIKTDNRIENLRLATPTENARNRVAPVREMAGITWCNRDLKWVVHIRHNGKKKYVGKFLNLDVAKEQQARMLEIALTSSEGVQ